MEALHKLKIDCPYEILKIENIKISNKPNEHAYLYLKCLVDDSINFKYATEASTEDTVILYEQLESGDKSIIFNGIIENVRTKNVNGVYYLELEGASRSSLLDIKVKSRSFQDAQMSYDNLINEVLKDYEGLGFTQCMSRPMSIGKPLFQYKETDYEFLKRVASLLGLEIICDIINTGNAFYFGMPGGKLYKLKDEINYTACKDLERYYKARTRGFGVDFHSTDFFYYKVEDRTKMDIGGKINFKHKDLYVNQYEAKLHKGELIYKYRFCRKNGIWQEKIYNHKIKGVSIEGEVLETKGEKLKIHLNIDESQDPSKAAWFYYAPPTGNILYSMPLVKERATLYFQDEIKADPIVTGCVRKNGNTCGAMSDTANRYFATESGNHLDMLPEAINFHRSNLNVNLNDGNGITFSSSGNLSISGGSVSLSAGSVSINATSQIKVQRGKTSHISLENELYAKASVVYENGSDRQGNPAFTDDEPTAGVAEAKKRIEEQAKQAAFKEMQLIGAMYGSEAKAKESSAPASKVSESEALKNRADIPEFNATKDYEVGTIVKAKQADGSYILGSTNRTQKIWERDLGGDKSIWDKISGENAKSNFTPCDWDSYWEHNSIGDSLKSTALAGDDVMMENGFGALKLYTYQFQDPFVGSEFGDMARNEIDDIYSKWHQYFYDNAPHKNTFNISRLEFEIAMLIDCGIGIYGKVGKIGKIGEVPELANLGKKVIGETKTIASDSFKFIRNIFKDVSDTNEIKTEDISSTRKISDEMEETVNTLKVDEGGGSKSSENSNNKPLENTDQTESTSKNTNKIKNTENDNVYEEENVNESSEIKEDTNPEVEESPEIKEDANSEVNEAPESPATTASETAGDVAKSNEGAGKAVKTKSEIVNYYNDIVKNLRDDIKINNDIIRNSDDFKNLSKTQQKKLERKLNSLENGGNIAVADVDIPGVKSKFQAHSQINSETDIGANVGDFSYKTENRKLTTYVDAEGFPRYHDTEAKILEDIEKSITNPNAKGKVDLYSELDCCQSCSNLILEFRRNHPNIELNIYVKSMQ